MLRCKPMTQTARRWQWVDPQPPEEPAFGRTPSHVEHEADFDAMTYVWRAHFINPEMWAESETSWASRHYEIAHEPGMGAGWTMRLVGRNLQRFEAPHAWEPVPPALASAWDRALA